MSESFYIYETTVEKKGDDEMITRKIKSVADKVKFLRNHEGLNVNNIAEKLKLHRDHVLSLENGTVKAELQDVIRYCDFFGLDYEKFLFDDLPKFKADYIADEKKLLKTIGYKI